MENPGTCETEAFVTLVTNDSYAYGALTLGQSLRNVNTTRQLAVVITAQVTQAMRRQMTMVFDHIQQVDPLDSNDAAHLALLARPELGITFSKIHCWSLTQYTKCVFLDADCLVLQNVDELFEREELSAAPDVGWPDCFNSGVFVFKPSDETHRGLLQCAVTQGSFDGGDQGLLNVFFKDWATKDINRHLPFIYNMTASISYSYLPAYRQFGQDVRIVHFIGQAKPWLYTYNMRTGHLQCPQGLSAQHDEVFLKKWWSIFVSQVKPRIEHEQREILSPSGRPPPLPPDTSRVTPPVDCSLEDSRQQKIENLPERRQSCPEMPGQTVEQLRFLPVNHTISPELVAPPIEQSLPVGALSGQGNGGMQSEAPIPPSQNRPSHSQGKDLADQFGDLRLNDSTARPRSSSPRSSQQAWERGEIDYTGVDRFDTILERIQQTLEEKDETESMEKEPTSEPEPQ